MQALKRSAGSPGCAFTASYSYEFPMTVFHPSLSSDAICTVVRCSGVSQVQTVQLRMCSMCISGASIRNALAQELSRLRVSAARKTINTKPSHTAPVCVICNSGCMGGARGFTAGVPGHSELRGGSAADKQSHQAWQAAQRCSDGPFRLHAGVCVQL